MSESLHFDRIRPALLCCGILLLTALSACGQSGPLFIPEEPAAESDATGQPAENGQESPTGDEDEEAEGSGR